MSNPSPSNGVILHLTSFCCTSAGTSAIRLRYRDLEEMMAERGLSVDHSTIYHWGQRYTPELEKRCRPHLKACNDSWRVDETYIKVKKVWTYLYRAVDSEGNMQGWASFPLKRQGERVPRYEIMNMMRKGQFRGVDKGDITGQICFIASLFGAAA